MPKGKKKMQKMPKNSGSKAKNKNTLINQAIKGKRIGKKPKSSLKKTSAKRGRPSKVKATSNKMPKAKVVAKKPKVNTSSTVFSLEMSNALLKEMRAMNGQLRNIYLTVEDISHSMVEVLRNDAAFEEPLSNQEVEPNRIVAEETINSTLNEYEETT